MVEDPVLSLGCRVSFAVPSRVARAKFVVFSEVRGPSESFGVSSAPPNRCGRLAASALLRALTGLTCLFPSEENQCRRATLSLLP